MSVLRSPLYSPLRSPLRSPLTRLKGGGVSVSQFLSSLALNQRAWWSYDLDKTLYRTSVGPTKSSATDLTGLWLDRANWDTRGVINIVRHSDEFGSWSRAGTATVTNDVDVGPDGTMTLDLVEGLGSFAGNDVFHNNYSVDAFSTRFEPSFYIKKVSATGTLAFTNRTSGALGNWSIDLSLVGSGLERITRDHAAVSISAEFQSSGAGGCQPNFHASAGAPLAVRLGGVQIELGTVTTAYQKVPGLLRGGPGNHGSQTTASSRPTLQTTGMRGDGSDDSLLTAITPGTVATAFVKCVVGAKGATRTLLGGSLSTTRYMLAIDADGLLCAGIGTDSITTIKGGSDLVGKTGTAVLAHDGSTVSLYWREVGGALETIYSAGQNGAPGSDPIRLFATNSGGSAGNYGNADIQHAIVAKKAATLSEIAALTLDLNSRP